MTTRKLMAILVATAALGAGAPAAVAASASANSKGEVLAFRDVTTASTLVDLNHNGVPDPGDYFVFHEEATRHRSVVEYNDSQCLVGFADQYLCHVVVVVSGQGQIVVDGSIAAPAGAFPTDFDLAITGGTGDFSNTGGHAHVHHVSDTVSEDTLFLARG
jgi:hypothetical protein